MLTSTRKSLIITIFCLSFIASSPLMAQDDPSSGGIRVTGMSFGGGPTDNDMNGDGTARPRQDPADPITLLNNKQVREELDLVGYQLQEFRDAQKRMQKEFAESSKAILSGNFDRTQLGDIAKQLENLKKEYQTQLESTLLPHQLKRLKQLALQARMKNHNAGDALISNKITEELGIDADQKQRIKDRAKELKQELAQRVADLKKEYQGKLLEELTSDQKAKLKELSGDDFDYNAKSK